MLFFIFSLCCFMKSLILDLADDEDVVGFDDGLSSVIIIELDCGFKLVLECVDEREVERMVWGLLFVTFDNGALVELDL